MCVLGHKTRDAAMAVAMLNAFAITALHRWPFALSHKFMHTETRDRLAASSYRHHLEAITVVVVGAPVSHTKAALIDSRTAPKRCFAEKKAKTTLEEKNTNCQRKTTESHKDANATGQ